tara:strand:+ start:3329 stop:4276 length:948 start_codon:yes stop_codon:yes gene_type:complete
MKILFITTKSKFKQGDLLELSILNGLRSVLGSNCIDYPKKKIMYHDFSESPKNTLHGKGFTLLTHKIADLSQDQRFICDIDAILYGCGHMYGEGRAPELEKYCDNIWFLDGHDLYGNAPKKIFHDGESIIATQFTKCFKRELVEQNLLDVYPTGFGIPTHRIMPIKLNNKTQMFQKTAPDNCLFKTVNDLGGGFKHHIFSEEKSYYEDLSSSWFGLTCKKGGWDCLRHYEIIASGALLLFKDYDRKPEYCSPQNLPCDSYTTDSQLKKIVSDYIVDGKPTKKYVDALLKQREWLIQHGTTEARALKILKTINEKL